MGLESSGEQKANVPENKEVKNHEWIYTF